MTIKSMTSISTIKKLLYPESISLLIEAKIVFLSAMRVCGRLLRLFANI